MANKGEWKKYMILNICRKGLILGRLSLSSGELDLTRIGCLLFSNAKESAQLYSLRRILKKWCNSLPKLPMKSIGLCCVGENTKIARIRSSFSKMDLAAQMLHTQTWLHRPRSTWIMNWVKSKYSNLFHTLRRVLWETMLRELCLEKTFLWRIQIQT